MEVNVLHFLVTYGWKNREWNYFSISKGGHPNLLQSTFISLPYLFLYPNKLVVVAKGIYRNPWKVIYSGFDSFSKFI